MIDVTEVGAAAGGFFAAFGAFRISAQREMRDQQREMRDQLLALRQDKDRLNERCLQLDAQMELVIKERTGLQLRLLQLLTDREGPT